MENITVTVPIESLKKAVVDSVNNIIGSSYNNPVKDAVEKAIKEHDGVIASFVRQLISDTLNDPKFKEKMGEIMVSKMIEAALKK